LVLGCASDQIDRPTSSIFAAGAAVSPRVVARVCFGEYNRSGANRRKRKKQIVLRTICIFFIQ
jgi:hypothetical protein